MKELAKFRVAAVQAAPCFLDREASVDKACRLIREAAGQGASLIVFPEVFVPGYPYWNWFGSPLQGSAWYRRLYLSSVEVPGEDVDRLCDAARAAGAYVVIGINERGAKSLGVLYNTNLIIGPDGKLLGKHRKLVPTFAEKLTWTGGDGSGLQVYDTKIGGLGVLACGENTNTLARYTLLAEGELVHVANYIGFPFVEEYDMPEAIKIRAGAHSFEGKVFTVVSCSAMSEEIIEMLGHTDEIRAMLSGTPNAISCVFGPDGKMVTEPLVDVEGIVYADIDLNRCIEPKQYHDIIGHYNRFDIFSLEVNRRPQSALTLRDIAQVREREEPASGLDATTAELPHAGG